MHMLFSHISSVHPCYFWIVAQITRCGIVVRGQMGILLARKNCEVFFGISEFINNACFLETILVWLKGDICIHLQI